MARLINGDAVANGIADYVASNAYLNDTALDALELVWKWVNEATTVDAVEVVRCKDCKHTEDMMPIENGKGCMMGDCTLRKEDDICVMVWGDDFCSYGERRTDG